MTTPALELRAIHKSFGRARALAGASLAVFPGEIHALLGENGAGKTTLVGIASGRLHADSGEILRNGSTVAIPDPGAARRAGIALVPQHDLLVEAASVADNLARLDPAAPLLEGRAARRRRVTEISERFHLDLGPPDALAGGLPVGTRQRIEIAGALMDDPAVLILDEPTAVLSPDETAHLFVALRSRVAEGKCVVLITHRLAEVFATADRLTVMARGRKVLTAPVAETSPAAVAEELVAGSEAIDETAVASEPHVLGGRALGLKSFRPTGSAAEPVTLTLAAGELLVFLAIDGNGADDLAAAIAGVRPADGEVLVHGVRSRTGDPRSFRRAGGAFVPADRRTEGLVLDFSISDNLALRSARFLVDREREQREANGAIARFGVRASSADGLARELSGGNQQKLVLARELASTPIVLVAIHPTRGLDIAASVDVHRRLFEARASGAAVLVVTADPEEAKSLGGTIRVVYRGRPSEPLSPETPLVELGRRMAGLAA